MLKMMFALSGGIDDVMDQYSATHLAFVESLGFPTI